MHVSVEVVSLKSTKIENNQRMQCICECRSPINTEIHGVAMKDSKYTVIARICTLRFSCLFVLSNILQGLYDVPSLVTVKHSLVKLFNLSHKSYKILH